MYEDFEERGIRRTIVSFDPFLKRDDVRGLTEVLDRICEVLDCSIQDVVRIEYGRDCDE